MPSFRIVTYNIHKSRGLDRRVRPHRIAQVLKQIDADIIALQEVVGMDEIAREHNQVRAIAEELGFEFRIGENRRHYGAAYGNALLTRLPILAQHNHDITWGHTEPRGCLEVTLALNPQDDASPVLKIFNVHLGTSFKERRHQSSRLLDVLENNSEQTAPRIVLGDFNEWTRGHASRLLQRHFNSAEPTGRLGRAWTYPGVLPLVHLDHIYFDPPLALERIALHRGRVALVASDHLPVVADFKLDL
jgi:endonuclease/exonuclease/phosphatase family metal-dependent hydrolase